MNNDTLNSMDQFKRAIIAIPQRLRRLAPAAIENGVRRRHARGGRRLLRMIPTRTLTAVRV